MQSYLCIRLGHQGARWKNNSLWNVLSSRQRQCVVSWVELLIVSAVIHSAHYQRQYATAAVERSEATAEASWPSMGGWTEGTQSNKKKKNNLIVDYLSLPVFTVDFECCIKSAGLLLSSYPIPWVHRKEGETLNEPNATLKSPQKRRDRLWPRLGSCNYRV